MKKFIFILLLVIASSNIFAQTPAVVGKSLQIYNLMNVKAIPLSGHLLYVDPLTGKVSSSDSIAPWIIGGGGPGTSYWALNGVNLYNIDTTHKVGINKKNPLYTLDVKGSLGARNVFLDSNLYTKDTNCILYFDPNGSQNLFSNNMKKATMDTAGQLNIAIGFGSGMSLHSSSHDNVIIGGSKHLKTGYENVSLGYTGITGSGSRNVYIGYAAGILDVGANKNVIIGDWSANSLRTGNRNVVIGNAANIIDASHQICIGDSITTTDTNQIKIANHSITIGEHGMIYQAVVLANDGDWYSNENNISGTVYLSASNANDSTKVFACATFNGDGAINAGIYNSSNVNYNASVINKVCLWDGSGTGFLHITNRTGATLTFKIKIEY